MLLTGSSNVANPNSLNYYVYLCFTVLICLGKLEGGQSLAVPLTMLNEKWLPAVSGLPDAGLELAVVGPEAVEGCLLNGPNVDPGVPGVCGRSSKSP